MRASGGGRIVTLGSLSGVYATEKFPGLGAYNVSKNGIVGLTESLAVEGRDHDISAVCVSPGAVDTRDAARGGAAPEPGSRPRRRRTADRRAARRATSRRCPARTSRCSQPLDALGQPSFDPDVAVDGQ